MNQFQATILRIWVILKIEKVRRMGLHEANVRGIHGHSYETITGEQLVFCTSGGRTEANEEHEGKEKCLFI